MSVSTEDPVDVIHPEPQAVLIEKFIGNILSVVVFTVFIGLFATTVTNSFTLGFIAAFVVVLGGFGVSLYAAKLAVANIEYKIYDDKIEASSGVFTTEHRTVRFDQITDITRKQSIIERRFGLGQVKLSTAGMDGKSIKMKDIPNHEHWYDTLRKKQAEHQE